MTWRVVFEPPSQAEVAEAIALYEARSYGQCVRRGAKRKLGLIWNATQKQLIKFGG